MAIRRSVQVGDLVSVWGDLKGTVNYYVFKNHAMFGICVEIKENSYYHKGYYRYLLRGTKIKEYSVKLFNGNFIKVRFNQIHIESRINENQ